MANEPVDEQQQKHPPVRGSVRRGPPWPGGQRPEFKCSFCGLPRDDKRHLIAGPNGVFICNDCVRLCSEMFAEMSAHLSRPHGAPGDRRDQSEDHEEAPDD